MLAIRLPSDIEERLKRLAHLTGRTKTFYVRQAVIEQLDELEDTYLAMKRLKRPVKRWKLEDLEAGLDLER